MRRRVSMPIAPLAFLAAAILLYAGCSERSSSPSSELPAADTGAKTSVAAHKKVDEPNKGGASEEQDPNALQAATDEHPAAGKEPTDSPTEPKQAAADDVHAGELAAYDAGHGPVHPPEHYVRLNGPLFEDWPQPQAAIVISGEQNGYIEPCGCAGLENQKGGLKRRHTFIKSLRERGWPLALVDLGGQIRRFGQQAEIKYRVSHHSLAEIGYDAVAFGPQDLQLPAEHLFLVGMERPQDKAPFVAANLNIEFDKGAVLPYRILQVGPKRVGVTAVLGPRFEKRVNNEGVVLTDAAEAIAAILPEMREKADLLLLLSHSTMDESRELAKRFPAFDVVATAGGADEPPLRMDTVEGTKTAFVEVGRKGMYVAVLGVFDDPEQPLRYERVPLDGRFPDSPEMQARLVSYQDELKRIELVSQLRKKAPPGGRKFVGTSTCADCHTQAYEVWKHTPHAHATQTLLDLTPPRHFDAECLSCHVTGWDPQGYVPFESGYASLEETPHLRTNGCENCHGPGEKHVAAEMGEIEADDAMLETLRAQMRLPYAGAEAKCVECHDHDNSPDFHKPGAFEEYWSKVEHKGKY